MEGRRRSAKVFIVGCGIALSAALTLAMGAVEDAASGLGAAAKGLCAVLAATAAWRLYAAYRRRAAEIVRWEKALGRRDETGAIKGPDGDGRER